MINMEFYCIIRNAVEECVLFDFFFNFTTIDRLKLIQSKTVK